MLPFKIAYADERLVIESRDNGVALLLKPFGQQFSLTLSSTDTHQFSTRLASFATIAPQPTIGRSSILTLYGPFKLSGREGSFYLAVIKRDEREVAIVLTSAEDTLKPLKRNGFELRLDCTAALALARLLIETEKPK